MLNLTANKPAKKATKIWAGFYIYRYMTIERIDSQKCWLVFENYTQDGHPARRQIGRFSTLRNAKLFVDWKKT